MNMKIYNRSKIAGLILLVLGLGVSCSSEDFRSNELSSQVEQDFDHFYPLGETATQLVGSDYVSVEPGEASILLSSAVTDASSYASTGGAHLFVNKVVEKQLSGRTISVIVRARGGTSSGLKIAYSTNDAGNSGWSWFELSEEFQDYGIEYSVPEMTVEGGDYVGLLPINGTVEVQYIGINVAAE